MILNKTNQSNRGFTIVELLVVIVVIGILASITIVSYTGITARANTSTNKQNANTVYGAVQTYYADNTSYPATNATASTVVTNINGGSTPNASQLPGSFKVSSTSITPENDNYDSVIYALDSTTGACIGYWDYSTSTATPGTAGVVWQFIGTATTGTNTPGTAQAATCSH